MCGSGLGRSLLAGFATQIGGAVETDVSETAYDFRVHFAPAAFDPADLGAAQPEDVADGTPAT